MLDNTPYYVLKPDLSFEEHILSFLFDIITKNINLKLDLKTNLVHLTICTISNHFDQFKNTGWVLQ